MLFGKWKKEWLENKKSELEKYFNQKNEEFLLKSRDLEHKNEKLKKQLELKNIELDSLLRSVDERVLELKKKDHELHKQIKLIEAKASPDKVWCEAFSLGFSKAWDMIAAVQMDGILRARKVIEDQAINRAISGGG